MSICRKETDHVVLSPLLQQLQRLEFAASLVERQDYRVGELVDSVRRSRVVRVRVRVHGRALPYLEAAEAVEARACGRHTNELDGSVVVGACRSTDEVDGEIGEEIGVSKVPQRDGAGRREPPDDGPWKEVVGDLSENSGREVVEGGRRRDVGRWWRAQVGEWHEHRRNMFPRPLTHLGTLAALECGVLGRESDRPKMLRVGRGRERVLSP